MPNSVDNRVVEMRFDNKQFEKNIHQSMQSLQKLDKTLDMTDSTKKFKKFENTVNNADFSKMEKSLQFIEYRLSALGMTSAKVINTITDKIGGGISKLYNMSFGQIKSGGMARALKLEHANFMLDGILKDAEKVKDIMDNAVSPAVDGTAYGLDAAANAASQFVASGIEDIDKLKTALTGISGVAAMSGSEYEEIAHIFTKVAASGRMMGDTVVELSTRGINAQAELAKYLDVSIDKVQEMQKKGQISFETFANAMNDAFGEQAKKANDTYTGALSNLKAALSRVGADFATPYLNNMREIFNALRLAINNGRKALAPLVNLYTNIFNRLKDFTVALLENESFINIYTNVIKGLCRSFEILSQLLEPIKRGFLNAFPQGMVKTLDEVTSKILNFMYKLQFNKGFLKDIGDFLGGIFSTLKLIGFFIEKITGVSSPVLKTANHLLGFIARILGIIGKLITQIVNTIMANRTVLSILDKIRIVIFLIIGALAKIVTTVISFIASFKDLPIVRDVFNAIGEAAKTLANVIFPKLAVAAGAVVKAFQYIINLGRSGAVKAFIAIKGFVSDLTKSLKSGKGVITSFASAFSKGILKSLPGTLHASAKGVNDLNDAVVNTTKSGGMLGVIKDFITKVTDFTVLMSGGLAKGFNALFEIIDKNLKAFGYGRAIIVGLGAGMISTLFKISGAVKSFKSAFDGIPGLISAATNYLKAPLFNSKAKAIIIGIAVAIGMLTLSLLALCKVDSNKLKTAAMAIGGIIAVMTLASVLINKLGGGFEGFKAVTFSFMSFSGAVIMLAGALMVLSKIELDDVSLLKRVGMLGLIMLELGTIVTLMTRLAKPWSVLLGGGFLISMGVAMLLLVKALNGLAAIEADKLNVILPMLLKAMGTLGLIAMSCSLLMPFAGINFITILGGLLAFMAGMTLIAKTLDPTTLEYINTIFTNIYNAIKGWIILFGIAAIIVLVTRAITKVSEAIKLLKTATTVFVAPATEAAKALKRLASAVVIGTITASIIAMAITIAKLGTLPEEQFTEGCRKALIIAIGFAGFMGAMMILQKVILGKDTEFLKGLGASVSGMALVLLAIARAMKVIAGIPAADAERARDIILWLVGAVVLFETLSALLAKNNKAVEMSIKTAIALSIFISAITLCVGLLSLLASEGHWSDLISAAGAMGIIMLGVAAICYTMGKIKFGAAIGAAIAIGGIFIALTYCMNILQNVDWNTATSNLGTILIAVTAMAALMYIVGGDKISKYMKKGIKTLLGVSIIFGAMTAIAYFLQDVNWSMFATNLGVILGAMSLMSVLMYVIGSDKLSERMATGLACLGGISLIFAIMTVIANYLQTVDWQMVASNMGVILVAVTAMAGLMYIIGGDKIWKSVAKGEALVAGITLIFAGLTAVATYLQLVDWNTLWKNFLIIEAAVAVMAGIMYVVGSDQIWGKIAIGELVVAGITIIFGALTLISRILATVNWNTLWKNFLIIEAAVAVMAGILYVIGNPAIAIQCAIGEVIVGLMSLIFWGLAGIAKILDTVNWDNLWKNFLIIEAAVSVMALIMGIIGIPAIAAMVGLGAVVVGAMTVVFWGLAKVAEILNQVDAHAFLENVKVMGIAVVGLGVLMGALGAIVMTGGGAVVLLAGAAALLVFAGVMYVFARVADSFATAGKNVAEALDLLGPAFKTVGEGLEEFSKHDFDGIIGNLITLAASVWVLGGIGEDAEKAATGLRAIGESTSSIHENVGNLSVDMDALATATERLKESVNGIKGVFKDLTKAAKEAVKTLSKKDILSVVDEFASQMKNYDPTTMESVGIKMVSDICAGCKKKFVDEIPNIILDCVNAFATEVDKSHDKIYAAGAKLGAVLVEGTRSSDGVDAHSDSWKFLEIGKDCINAIVHYFNDHKSEARSAAKDLGKEIPEGTKEGIEDGSEDVEIEVKDMLGNALTKGKEKLDEAKDNLGKYLDSKTSDGIDEDSGTVSDNLQAFLSGLIADGQGYLNNNVLHVLFDTQALDQYGLTEAQRAGAAAEDKKRSDTYGYNTLEELQKAGQRGDLAHKWSHKAAVKETTALNTNTEATGKNTKAKKENKKANEKKNKSIDAETEALGEEEEAANENSEAIREMAEQIEVVTEEYNKLNHYQGISKATVVRLANNSKRINKLWSGELTTLKQVNARYKEISKSIPNMVKASKRGLYAFGDGIKNVRKIYKKTGLKKSVDTIRKYVERTGNSVAKVTANTLKVFYKAGSKVEKIFLNPVKKMSKIPGMLKKALNTVAFFNRDMTSVINSYEWSDDVISHVRMIEESFGRVKFGQMSGGVQNYLKNVLGRFKELNPAISQISKSLGGTYNVFSKNSRAAAATADSLISLGAVLYNGSDAANEYATKIAQLEFLYEHGEISWEELQEAKIDYLTRIKDALMEYKQSLDETYMSEVDFFSAFNKNELDKNVNLMENLFSNISGYYTYGAMLTELSRRVPALQESTQLVKMLADAGVDSFGKLQKVLEMSTSELNAYIYGIGVLNKTQEEASNKAFAAVANATSYAAKRQQAQAKDVMKKTTKYSKDVRKAIMSDMDAVAQATTEYNILTKKQEKEYLKTLTKEEQKYYKKQKSYYKKAKKDYEAQRKAQTEKEYVKQLLENIKTFADYSKALVEYTGDTKALTSFTNKFNEAFADLSKNAKEVGVNLDAADDSLLIFAETLDATGEDGLNYFEEMAKRIQNMVNGIKETVTSVNVLTTAFEKAASVKFKNVYDNVISNLIGSSDITSQLSTLATKGYNTEVLKKVKDIYDSDRSAFLEIAKALNSASAEDVARINAALEKYSTTAANTEGNVWVTLLKDAEKTKAEHEKEQTDALNKYTQAVNTRKAKENELKALQSQKDTIDTEKQRLKELKKNIKDGDKLSKKTEKEYIALLKKYGGSYKGKDYKVSAPLQTWFDENGVQKSGTAYAKLKSDIAKATKEVNALRDAEDKAHQEYLDATKQLEEYNAELKKSIDNVTKDENAKKWFDNVIKGEKTLLTMIKSVAKGTHEYVKALGYAVELQTKFNDEIVHYNIDGLYSNIKALEDATAPIGTIVDGLDSFGKSLVEAADRTAEGIIEAIEEYKKSLTDTIKQSSDFFSKFSGFADEDNPLQATDYLEYADSQINALETWYKNLEKLADLGLDKELVEKFASQGLGSYEIVAAFAKATKAQIGEYNAQWKQYQDTITAATESAMTSIAASWSTAGQALSQSMIDYFGTTGADRLKEAGYEASAMVITGVKDGLTEAMPTIISAVEHTDTSGMSKAIGKSVGQGINAGLVEAVQGSVNETVTAVIEKFKMAVDSVLAYVNEVLPSDYTITIHVDASEIDAAVARMNQAIYATNVSAGQTSNAVASSTANQAATEVIPSEPLTNTVNLNYTQNNYSPKALDQVEIYRNTQNQLNSTKQIIELQGT